MCIQEEVFEDVKRKEMVDTSWKRGERLRKISNDNRKSNIVEKKIIFHMSCKFDTQVCQEVQRTGNKKQKTRSKKQGNVAAVTENNDSTIIEIRLTCVCVTEK